MNTLTPIDSLMPTNDFNSGLNVLTGGTDFGSVFNQALSQAKTPADKAKVSWLQAEYSDLNTLSSMDDPSSSSDVSGLAGLFDLSGAFTLPSWTSDAERLFGQNSDIQQLMGLTQSASLAAQSLFSNDLSSLGTGVNSIF